MKTKLLNNLEDIGWLLQTHLKGCNILFNSFIITGNEDCPHKVELFDKLNPTIHSKPKSVFVSDKDGNLKQINP